MKPKLSAREIAREMANIMVEHLETLPAKERHKKIQAGQKVIKGTSDPRLRTSGTGLL